MAPPELEDPCSHADVMVPQVVSDPIQRFFVTITILALDYYVGQTFSLLEGWRYTEYEKPFPVVRLPEE
jgi:hypothetical protein